MELFEKKEIQQEMISGKKIGIVQKKNWKKCNKNGE